MRFIALNLAPSMVLAMKRLLIYSALLAQACASSHSIATAFGPSELKANATRYDGQSVEVRGYVILGTNGRSLCQSKDEFDQWKRALNGHASDFNPHAYENLCLTMLNADLLLEHADEFHGKTMTFRGKFIRHYNDDGRTIDLQAWGENAVILDNLNLRQLRASIQGN